MSIRLNLSGCGLNDEEVSLKLQPRVAEVEILDLSRNTLGSMQRCAPLIEQQMTALQELHLTE